jgi:alcohol dehydrogenase (cytochrome c)
MVGISLSLSGQTSRPVNFDRIRHADRESQNWLTYSGTLFGQRHTRLAEITPANVADLEVAWAWQGRSPERTFQATPLVADGVLYTVQPPNDVVALDAGTGRVLWTYRHQPPAGVYGWRVNRGVAILGDAVFMGTIDAHLLAIHAKTGELIWDAKVADSAAPACQAPPPSASICYSITHAPLVVEDKVIVGTSGGDTDAGYGIRGFVAAFDARTGKEVWRFHTIPTPDERGGETWSGDSWKTGGVGVWNTGTYDADLGVTYWGTGNPAPAARPDLRRGDNLYSNSVIALDAATGALKWHYQSTPHDDQDWDATSIPVLADIQWEGRLRKVLLQANKNGLFYVLDRVTGEFLKGTPFVEVDWMEGFDRNGRPIRRPGKLPGTGGGTGWRPPSYSPATGLLYVPATERGGVLRALDPLTGNKQWEFRADDGRSFTAGVLTTVSNLVFTGDSSGKVYALHGASGALLWNVAFGREGRGVWSGPMSYAIGTRQYVVVTADQSVFALALRR